MTETTRQPQIANDLIWRLLDNNAVVVSPHVGEVRVLNGIGTVIWQLLVEKRVQHKLKIFWLQTTMSHMLMPKKIFRILSRIWLIVVF